MTGEAVPNLAVSRDWLRDTRVWVAIPIVFASMVNEETAKSFDGADPIEALHDTTRSSTFRTPGICPEVRST